MIHNPTRANKSDASWYFNFKRKISTNLIIVYAYIKCKKFEKHNIDIVWATTISKLPTSDQIEYCEL